MNINGACHCGSITYHAEVDPEAVEVCHCTDCQTLSGSAFRVAVPAVEGSFELLTGTPRPSGQARGRRLLGHGRRGSEDLSAPRRNPRVEPEGAPARGAAARRCNTGAGRRRAG